MQANSTHKTIVNGKKMSFWRILLRIVVICHVIVCLLILSVRWLVTHKIDSVREDLTQEITKITGVKVTSSKFTVDFHYIWPVIRLENVTLARKDGPISLKLPRIEAELSWASLFHLEPRFRVLLVTNPEFTIRRLTDNSFDIGGYVLDTTSFAKNKKAEEEQEITNNGQKFLSWLFTQNELALNSGSFTYIDERGKHPLSVSIKKASSVFRQDFLAWHFATEGSIYIDGTERQFIVRSNVEKSLFSDTTNPLTWTGKAYAHFDSIDFGSLMRHFGYTSVIKSGEGAVRLWTSFEKGRISEFVSDVGLNIVNAQLDKSLEPLNLPHFMGRIKYSETNDGFMSFKAENLQFRLSNKERFGPTNLSANCKKEESSLAPQTCSFEASRLNIDTISSLSKSLPLPENVISFMKEHPLSGKISNLSAEFNNNYKEPQNWKFKLAFYGLSIGQASDNVPTFRNLAGHISSPKPGVFDLTLDSPISSLRFPGVFRDPLISLDELKTKATIYLNPTPKLVISSFSASNSDASIDASGFWTADKDLGKIDIKGNIYRAKGPSVPKYLPTVIGQDTLTFLDKSILAANVTRGSWVVKGALKDFPWHGTNPKESQFMIEADLDKGSYDFMPDYVTNKVASQWPTLENISAHLLFEGNRMLITGKSLTSEKLKIKDVTVEIPNYTDTPTRLIVNGNISGKGQEVFDYLSKAYELNSIVGDLFKPFKVGGEENIQLYLDIPLSEPQNLHYKIAANLKDADVTWGTNLPTAKKANGTIFVEDGVVYTKDPIFAVLANEPLKIGVNSDSKKVNLDFDGTLTIEELDRIWELDHTLIKTSVTGKTKVSLNVNIPLGSDKFTVSGSTDLVGLASVLPAPLSKTAQESWPTKFEFDSISRKESTLKIDSEKVANLNVLLLDNNDGTGVTIDSGYINIGAKGKNTTDYKSLTSKIKLAYFNLDEWTTVLRARQSTIKNKDPLNDILKENEINVVDSPKTVHASQINLDKLSSIDIDVSELIWENSTIKDFDVNVNATKSEWLARFNSNTINGTVRHSLGKKDSFVIRFNKLQLPDFLSNSKTNKSTSNEEVYSVENPLITKNFPNFDVVIDNLKIGGKDFGKIELNTVNRANQLSIQHFAIKNIGATLSASGYWSYPSLDKPKGETSLDFALDISDSGVVLHSLNIKDAIHNAPGAFTGKLSWLGQPHQFNAQTLSGTIKGDLGAGRIIQVEPGAGRLLSLLSMQHILRRLTLDFSDVVSKGFSFDSFTTDISIINGLMHSKRATLVGSAATIAIEGDIDLNNELLDLYVVVLPSLNAESASIALAIANPAVGLGTLFAQLAFKDQISQLFSSEYRVRGNFDEPEVIKLEKQKLNSKTEQNP